MSAENVPTERRLRRSEAISSTRMRADERPDRVNESGLSDPSASLDYTEERPG